MITKIVLITITIILCLASFGAGRYLLPVEHTQADYYRGVYDLCRSMVMITGQWVDCQAVAQTAKNSAWYEQTSAGWIWPLE